MATETSTANNSASPENGGTGTGGASPTIERMFDDVAGTEGETLQEQPKESRSEREPKRRTEPKPEEDDLGSDEGEGEDEDPDDLGSDEGEGEGEDEDGDDEPDEGEEDPEIELDDKGTKAKLSEVKAGYLRQQDYTRKTTELAADRDTVYSYAGELKAERDAVVEAARGLNALAMALQPSKETWDALKAGDPKQYIAAQEEWGKVQAARAQILKVAQDAITTANNNSVREREVFIRAENAKLKEIMPAIFDPTKGPKIQERIYKYGERVGYTRDELMQAVDHREIMTLWKAMRYDEIKGASADVGKPQKRSAPAPKPIQGNRAPQKQAQPARGVVRQQAERKERVQRADAALRKTGSVEDAAMAFTARFG